MGLEFGTVGNLFGNRTRVGEGFSTDKQQQAILDNKIDERFVKTEALDNALNVMELQVAAAVTPTDLGNMEIEIFSDSDGFIDTVDLTSNTTAGFDTDKYTTSETISIYAGATADTTPINIDVTCTAKKIGFINKVRVRTNGPGTWRIDIDQAEATLASASDTTSGIGTIDKNFVIGDYSSLIQVGTFNILITRTAGSDDLDADSGTSHDSDNFSFTSQEAPIVTSGNEIEFTKSAADGIIQTNVITVVDRIVDFMVVAYKKATTGTGTITYDISFDNGTTFQTSLPLDTIINVQKPGTQLILKVNLNEGTGSAECKGYGVRYWV